MPWKLAHHRRKPVTQTKTKTQKAGGFRYAYAIVAACIAMTCLPLSLIHI